MYLFYRVSIASLFFLSSLLWHTSLHAEKTEQQSILKLRLHGSNTIGEKFAPELIKGFFNQQGYIAKDLNTFNRKIERHIIAENRKQSQLLEIELFAHGSTTGFQDLLSLNTDIAMSSRPIKAKEIRQLSRVFPSIVNPETEHVIAYDALAILVNPKNTINNLSLKKLALIFSGEITNWKALGGEDLAIKILSRDDNSGTYDTFKSLVLKPNHKKLNKQGLRFESSALLTQTILADEGAIGFVGISYTASAKVLAISVQDAGHGVLPERHTIGTEDYPLSRKLYLYLPLEIENPLANKFINFATSDTGQSLAKRSQLISFLPTKSKPYFANRKLNREFKNLRTFGQRLSVTFRLDDEKSRGKSTRDLERLVSYFKFNPHQKIVLVGFWDDPEFNLKSQNSIQRWMDSLSGELAKNDVSPWKIKAGFLPIENNAIDEGRMINRRVEVWVL